MSNWNESWKKDWNTILSMVLRAFSFLGRRPRPPSARSVRGQAGLGPAKAGVGRTEYGPSTDSGRREYGLLPRAAEYEPRDDASMNRGKISRTWASPGMDLGRTSMSHA